MGHVKEPEGVDFIIQSEPLTATERVAISEFIRNYKAEQGASHCAEGERGTSGVAICNRAPAAVQQDRIP